MKNIHILPTDKTSRLHYFTANKAGYYLYPNNELVIPRNPNCINQNIYITSDEEIKEGDWYYLQAVSDIGSDSGTYRCEDKTTSKLNTLASNCKKIILTTDQDLIKDGIQAIDDEFLEWFVKNPSCEEVKFEKWTDYRVENDKEVPFFKYKIIIPKEEPKQENIGDIFISTVFLGLDHAWDSDTPVLWETMIFGGEHDQYQERYTSYEDALEGHKKALTLITKE